MAKRAPDDDDDDDVADDDAREAELEGGRMPFLAHLRELRDRVMYSAIAFVVAFLVCWYFAHAIFEWLRQPLFDIWIQHTCSLQPHLPAPWTLPCDILPADDWGPPVLIYTGLTQPFWVDMSVGLWAGIFAASPMIFYQLWRFIAPGLYKKERRVTIAFAILSAVFFTCGALFCFYFALPKLYEFFLSYNDATTKSLPTMSDYLDLTRDSMLAFGAIFEMPLLIYFLAMVGLVTHRGLWKFSRWFIVLAFIIGAVLTPGPDVVSQFMMATPMIVLYNVSILFAWRVTVKRERAAAALDRQNQSSRDDEDDEDADEDEDEDEDDETER